MSETILSKLEASRKELLDLGLRNPLLNYKLSAGRGLQIVQEKSAAIYDVLVRQGKGMSFLGRSTAATINEEVPLTNQQEPDLAETQGDTKLQTNEPEKSLQTRLLNTYYAAKTSLEEQGVNILYVSLGMLHWYETSDNAEERQAPLLLIPVTLERSSARERFRVKYTQEEIGDNVSLQAKMKAAFGIILPDMPDAEDFEVTAYFDSIKKVIDKIDGWKVEPDAIALGFFSFGKFMLYNDLDSNNWPADSQPAAHPILQDLFENGFRDAAPTASEGSFIDKDTNAHQLFQVVDADSSQLLAMLAIDEGRNLVIQGPPGTGKSQTITNIIANAIGQGKKVLFVAEKMAALEVVKRRLDAIHLGDACLELHSHKANKKELHQELRRVLELGKPTFQQLEAEVALLENYKDELNAYCLAINTPIGASGITGQQLIGYLLQLYSATAGIAIEKISFPSIDAWDATRMKRAEAFAERIQAKLADIGLPQNLLFRGSTRTVMLPNEQDALLRLLPETNTAIGQLMTKAHEVATALGVAAPLHCEATTHLASIVRLASLKPDLRQIAIKHSGWLENQQAIGELLETGTRLTALHDTYAGIFIPEAWEQPVIEIRENLLAYGDKWYKFLISSYNKSKKQLAALCAVPLPAENSTRLSYVNALLEGRRLAAVLKEQEPLAVSLFGERWQKKHSKWTELATVRHYMVTVHQQIAGGICPASLLHYLEKHLPAAEAKKHFDELTASLATHRHYIEQVVTGIAMDESRQFNNITLLQLSFSEQVELVTAWHNRFAEIHQAISWNNLVETANEEQLQPLIATATHWERAIGLLKTALQKTWYEYLLEQAITAHAALRKFDRTSHEEVVQQFRRLDVLYLQYNRARAALTHYKGMPRQEAGGSVNILRTEFNKKARHRPIRKLMHEAGLAIQAIKPVFMMSPLSIANFLAPGVLEFDLVIFDEASQVRPVEALGALLRGKQLVVVGDTKQLPPTSFFDSLTKEVDDEENVTADLQSILGMCDAQGAPQRMLRWHYRSRHESLITVSNHAFYEKRLVIFPSPGAKHRLGLAFNHLPDTVYDRGNTRTNAKEAETVAEAVMAHAKKYPNLTLGVVAFSTAQRQAIQDALEIKMRKNAEAETFFKAHAHEPFFIKNLENVQGDERDVIFISIGYGRTADGSISMLFGPLNNEGGERRLNVLITRARLRCEVFTNITAENIDVNRTKSQGIVALKTFLHFAQHGKLNTLHGNNLVVAHTPFEDNVAKQLTQLGYGVHRQLGSQGFYLDMAIVDHEHPGRYLLGIECDGAAYHTAQSARDRDRLRQQVLEDIGWNIHRIWSSDWFKNPEREIKRVIAAIEKAKLATACADTNEAEEYIEPTSLQREAVTEPVDTVTTYKFASVPAAIALQEIHLHEVGQLAVWIEEIVKVESPVHFDEVARRLLDAAGIGRIGSRIKECLQDAVDYAAKNKWLQVKAGFLWHRSMQQPVLRDRSNLPAAAKKIKYIAPEEIQVAIEKVVRESIAIEPAAAVPYVAKLLGFSRVTEELKQDLLTLIQQSIAQNIVLQDGALLKVAS